MSKVDLVHVDHEINVLIDFYKDMLINKDGTQNEGYAGMVAVLLLLKYRLSKYGRKGDVEE